jgi:hypothetical protein
VHDNDLERALSGDPGIVPSSGFVHAVMSAVHEEADAPAPIPFPWGRAIAGASTAILTMIAVALRLTLRSAPLPSTVPDTLRSLLEFTVRLAQNQEVWSIALALVITVCLVELPRRLFVRAH